MFTVKKARYILLCGVLVLMFFWAGCSARPTIYADDDPIFQEVAAMQADACSLSHGEQAVVISERIEVTAKTADAIDITLHRSILFGKGAMGGTPAVRFSYHPARGEQVVITKASARLPDGRTIEPVYGEDIPPSDAESVTDPDVRKVMARFVMPQGGVVDVTVQKHVKRLPMLPGVSAVVMSGLSFRRCSVSAAITHPVSLPVHVRSAFSPEAAMVMSTKELDGDRVEKSWLVEAMPPSVKNEALLEFSTLSSWQSLGQALKNGFIPRLDADAEQLSIGKKGMTPQQVLQKVQSMVETCPRRALNDTDFVLPMSLKTTADWGCGACRDLSALLALGLRQAGYIPNLVFVRPSVGLTGDFPTDNLPHVIVSVFHKLKMYYFDPTIVAEPGTLHASIAGTNGLVVPLVPHPDVVPTLMRIPHSGLSSDVSAAKQGNPEAWRMELHDKVDMQDDAVAVERSFQAAVTDKNVDYSFFEIPWHVRDSRLTAGNLFSGETQIPHAFILDSGSGPGSMRPNRKKRVVIPGSRLGLPLSGTYSVSWASGIWGEIPTPSGGIVSRWKRELADEAQDRVGLVTSERFGVNGEILPDMPAVTDVAIPGKAWRPRGMVWVMRRQDAPASKWPVLGAVFKEVQGLRTGEVTGYSPAFRTNISWGLPGIVSKDATGDALLFGSPWSDMAQRRFSGYTSRMALLIPCTDTACTAHRSYLDAMPVVLTEDEMGSDIVQPFLSCSPLDILDGTPAVLMAEQSTGKGGIEQIELLSRAVEPSNVSIQIKVLLDEQGNASVSYGMAASGSARCMISSCRGESAIPPRWVLMKKRDRSLVATWNTEDTARRLGGGFIYDVILPFARCPHFFSNNSIQISVRAKVSDTCIFRSKSYRKSKTIGDGREEISLHTTKSNVTFHQTRYWGEIRPGRGIRNMGLTLEYECYQP